MELFSKRSYENKIALGQYDIQSHIGDDCLYLMIKYSFSWEKLLAEQVGLILIYRENVRWNSLLLFMFVSKTHAIFDIFPQEFNHELFWMFFSPLSYILGEWTNLSMNKKNTYKFSIFFLTFIVQLCLQIVFLIYDSLRHTFEHLSKPIL